MPPLIHAREKTAKKKIGYSLIELMVVVAVLALIATLAAPGVGDLQRSYQIRSVAGDLKTAIELARSEAMRRNVTVDVVFDYTEKDGKKILTDYTICTNKDIKSWDATSRPCPAENQVLRKSISSNYLWVQAGLAGQCGQNLYIRFESTGFSNGGCNGRISIQDEKQQTGPHIQLVINRIGTVRSCTAKMGDFKQAQNQC